MQNDTFLPLDQYSITQEAPCFLVKKNFIWRTYKSNTVARTVVYLDFYRNGALIHIELATRTKNEVKPKPYFEISNFSIAPASKEMQYDPTSKRFIFKAMFDDKYKCFYSNYFGFVPLEYGEIDKKLDNIKKYTISAEQNRSVGAQTILWKGKLFSRDNF
uniref:Uncharacterized protein n=1 Tax=Bursaphelenchus xylophilus TaxID=6326 RepID=A0A1I7SK50_BURXY